MIRNQWNILFTVAATTLMATMDVSITNIAFPELTRVFRTELPVVMWVTVAFILVSTSSMLIIGKIGDMLGRKRIFLAGIVAFTLGLAACSLAGTIGQLILFRAFQAVGASMTISCGTAIVTEAFPARDLGKGLGLLGISVSLGFIAGPIIGGLLLDFLDWRSIFYIRIPLGVAAFLMALAFLQNDPAMPRKIRLDITGAVTSSAGIFLFVYSLTQIRQSEAPTVPVLPVTGLGLALIAAFIFLERRAPNPIVDTRLFKDKVFSSAIGGLFLIFVAAASYSLLVPFYLMRGLEMRASEAGMLMAVTSVATMIFGPVSGWLTDRFGRVGFAATGAGLLTAAFSLMLGFDLDTPVTSIAAVFVVVGMGAGTFQPANNSIIMGAVGRGNLGTASALIATMRQVGMAVGMAVSGTLFSAWREGHQEAILGQGIEAAYAARQAVAMAFHDVFLIALVINVLVILLCLLPLWTKGKTPHGGRSGPRPRIALP